MNKDHMMGDMHQNEPMRMQHQYRYPDGAFNIDASDFMKRLMKYLFEGLVVAFVAYFVAKGRLDGKNIFYIGVTAAATFALLDTYSPTVSLGARLGAGWGIGSAIVGPTGMMAAAPVAMM